MRDPHVTHPYLNDQSWDSRFLFPNPLLALGEFLVKFSENATFPVSVRSLDQDAHLNHMPIIMHNKASAEVRGFKEAGKVGMTIPDVLDTLLIEPTMKAAELKQMAQTDSEVLAHNHQQSNIQTTLDKQGHVRIYQRIVTPVSGYKSQAVAIASFSLEVTHNMNLLQLLGLYKQYYNQNRFKLFEGIKKYFYYLNLEHYFSHLLNDKEMSALLAMVSDSRHKEAAALITQFNRQMCTPRNMASYVSLLKEKLKEGSDLYAVLHHLREQYQLTSVNKN